MKARVRAEETHCAWCGELVDKNLSGKHPDGPVIDHVIELTHGGDPLDRANLQLMHRRCNGEKEARRRATRLGKVKRLPRTREW